MRWKTQVFSAPSLCFSTLMEHNKSFSTSFSCLLIPYFLHPESLFIHQPFLIFLECLTPTYITNIDKVVVKLLYLNKFMTPLFAIKTNINSKFLWLSIKVIQRAVAMSMNHACSMWPPIPSQHRIVTKLNTECLLRVNELELIVSEFHLFNLWNTLKIPFKPMERFIVITCDKVLPTVQLFKYLLGLFLITKTKVTKKIYLVTFPNRWIPLVNQPLIVLFKGSDFILLNLFNGKTTSTPSPRMEV